MGPHGRHTWLEDRIADTLVRKMAGRKAIPLTSTSNNLHDGDNIERAVFEWRVFCIPFLEGSTAEGFRIILYLLALRENVVEDLSVQPRSEV